MAQQDTLDVFTDRGAAAVKVTPVMDWRDTPSFLATGGFSTLTTGRRSGAGTFELWSGTDALRVLPDLRAAGAGLSRPPATGGTLTIQPTNVADATAGAGANSVIVSYIEAGSFYERFGIASTGNGADPQPVLKAELVDGVPTVSTGPVPVTDAVRVNGARVLTAGASVNLNGPGATNTAGISILIAGAEQAHIQAGRGRALAAHGMVPRGYSARLTGIGMMATDPTGLDVQFVGQVWRYDTENELVLAETGTDHFFDIVFPRGSLIYQLPAARRLPPMFDFSIRVTNGGAAQDVAILLDLTFVPDPDDPDNDLHLQPPRLDGGGR